MSPGNEFRKWVQEMGPGNGSRKWVQEKISFTDTSFTNAISQGNVQMYGPIGSVVGPMLVQCWKWEWEL